MRRGELWEQLEVLEPIGGTAGRGAGDRLLDWVDTGDKNAQYSRTGKLI